MKPLALASAVLLVGCASFHAPMVGEPGPTHADQSVENLWQQMVERYTDQKAIYDGLDSRAFAALTWQSAPLVDARVQRECDFKGLSAAEARTRLEDERARLAQVTEFHLGAQLSEPKFEDFDKRTSMWRLTLVVGGVEYAPVGISRQGKATLAMRAIYPYLDEFWYGYTVQFPKVTVGRGDTLTVRLASAVGRADFDFKAE